MRRSSLILTILPLIAGCFSDSSSVPQARTETTRNGPDDSSSQFEAVWRAINHPEFKLYLGQKRWFVFRDGPSELRVWGRIDSTPSSAMPSVLDATLHDYETDDAELMIQLNQLGPIEATFVRDGDFLRVFATDVGEWKLQGVYRYESDDTPAKGYNNVRTWGADG